MLAVYGKGYIDPVVFSLFRDTCAFPILLTAAPAGRHPCRDTICPCSRAWDSSEFSATRCCSYSGSTMPAPTSRRCGAVGACVDGADSPADLPGANASAVRAERARGARGGRQRRPDGAFGLVKSRWHPSCLRGWSRHGQVGSTQERAESARRVPRRNDAARQLLMHGDICADAEALDLPQPWSQQLER